jgi:uncharacterized protein DUF3626
MALASSQRAALQHVASRVRHQRASARARIIDSLHRAGCSVAAFDSALECVRAHARVVIHFHPDRLGFKQMLVAEALLEDGIYRNQFETGLSTGGLFPVAGSQRDSWERELFGGAYQVDTVTHSERPKYGALELVRYADGPIPRFGSCYFVLRQAVSSRASFTFAGSEDPRASERVGTIDMLDAVMAALLDEIEGGGMAAPPWPPFRAPTLGVPTLTIARVLQLFQDLAHPRKDPSHLEPGRVLDTQVEAQVHGPIDLREDVELLVADPAFAETSTGSTLRALATRYDVSLCWHAGFQLAVRDVPDDFRGAEMPRLARRIAGDDGIINAAVIGAAEASLHRKPEEWRNWGTRAETLQHLKQLWHVLVHYGSAVEHR